jgi:MFS family permease
MDELFSRRDKIKAILIVSSGNFLEMFDFMVYGYYAAAIARTYFPSSDDFASLMAALSAFGAGFLMRPIGALLLGAYIDRHGRRKGLLLSLGLMALGTLSIALMPSYARVGVAAPLAILFGRLIQGLSAGVEVGGVSVYLSEIATPGNKGFYVSWQSASQQAAVAFAAVLGLAANQVLSKAQMADWGWRAPFVIGCALVPLLFLIRRNLAETPVFLARTAKPTTGAIFKLLGRNWGVVLLGTMMAVMTTVSFYMITAYTPTFGASVLHLPAQASFLVTLCVGVSNFVLLPIMGAVSDRVGRRRQLIAAATIAILTSYPAMLWLVYAPSFQRLLTTELWLSLIYAAYNGAMVIFLTEVIPLEARTAGFSFAYSLATAVFGGFTPAACTYLIHISGNKAVPGLWLSAAALFGLIATVLLRSPPTSSEAAVPQAGSPRVASTSII